MNLAILTGFAAGAIHVVSGADHLVSMAPSSIKKSPSRALKEGFKWGFGHSIGILILSSLALLAKDLINIDKVSSFAELTVGIFLLVVGVWAIRSSIGLNIHMHKHRHTSGEPHKHVHLHFLGKKFHDRHTHTSTSLGLIHGLAGGGHLLAVLPALALPAFGAFLYMISYLIGSVTAMALSILLFSIASSRIHSRYLPLLMGSTGGLSIATGFYWIKNTSVEIF